MKEASVAFCNVFTIQLFKSSEILVLNSGCEDFFEVAFCSVFMKSNFISGTYNFVH